MSLRSVPLAERRAGARALEEAIRGHRHDGVKCKPACAELTGMRTELAAIRREIATWFAPGPDDPVLFDMPQEEGR